jgi:hypothetical protein
LWLYLLEDKKRKLLNLPLVIKTGFAGNFPLSFPNSGFFFVFNYLKASPASSGWPHGSSSKFCSATTNAHSSNVSDLKKFTDHLFQLLQIDLEKYFSINCCCSSDRLVQCSHHSNSFL